MKFENRVAIVTGAIRGIGLEIAVSLLERGVKCAVTYYDWLDHLNEMKKRLDSVGTEYLAIKVDLRERDAVRKAIEATCEEFGRLDILINNIERGGWPVVHGPYVRNQWLLEFDTTVTAKWYLFEEALEYLKKSPCGCVLNISSIAGMTGRCGPAGMVFNDCYSIANRAIGLLTEQWARMAAPNVRVNELCLGFFETRHGPGTRGWSLMDDKAKEELTSHILLKRTGKLDEIKKAVEFLVFDATYVTGTRLIMDGGYLLGGERVPEMPRGVVDPNAPTFGDTIEP